MNQFFSHSGHRCAHQNGTEKDRIRMNECSSTLAFAAIVPPTALCDGMDLFNKQRNKRHESQRISALSPTYQYIVFRLGMGHPLNHPYTQKTQRDTNKHSDPLRLEINHHAHLDDKQQLWGKRCNHLLV